MNHISLELLAITACLFGLVALAFAGALTNKSWLAFIAVFAAAFLLVPLFMALNHRIFEALFHNWASSLIQVSSSSPQTFPAGWLYAFPCALLEFLLLMVLTRIYRKAKRRAEHLAAAATPK